MRCDCANLSRQIHTESNVHPPRPIKANQSEGLQIVTTTSAFIMAVNTIWFLYRYKEENHPCYIILSNMYFCNGIITKSRARHVTRGGFFHQEVSPQLSPDRNKASSVIPTPCKSNTTIAITSLHNIHYHHSLHHY